MAAKPKNEGPAPEGQIAKFLNSPKKLKLKGDGRKGGPAKKC